MKLLLIVFLMLTMSLGAKAQTSMLGGTLRYVYSRYNEDPEFNNLRIDTLETGNLALRCRSNQQYPYFIYEFSNYDECVSFTVISNNRQVFATYMDFLKSAGSLITFNDVRMVYQIRTMADEYLIYTISEPFKNNDLVSKRSVFSVQIEKKL